MKTARNQPGYDAQERASADAEPSAAFTPGPWTYIDATKVASMQYSDRCVIKAGDRQIASFSWNDNSPWFPAKLASQANARLIAAAPDLFAALKQIEDLLAFHDGSAAPEHDGAQPTVRINGEDHRAALATVRAALAKASPT